jgi:mannosyl-oligosaccharide alpha-1,2-mannosidase
VDQYGDHFYPSLPSQIAPAHPDLSLLPSPASLFSEIDIPSHLKPPQGLPFPEERMEQIYYAVPEEPSAAHRILPADSYAATWEGPVMWDQPRGEAKNVQWEGFQSGKRWETKAQKEVREERREAVRRGFVHAWQAYKDHAWGE